MESAEVRYETSAGVARVTLNRPEKLNAWTARMDAEFSSLMRAAAADAAVRVIVVTGAGRGFCAGADMSLLHRTSQSGLDSQAALQSQYAWLLELPKPVIAAVNGPAVGLGFVIALFCDLRIASAQARFSTVFARRGLIAEYGLAWMLPRLIGTGNALDLLLTGRTFDAAEALRLGLVQRVFPDDAFATEADAFAADLAAAVSPRSLRVIKSQVYRAWNQALPEALALAHTEMLASLQCEDFKEGVAGGLEKRPPRFTGK